MAEQAGSFAGFQSGVPATGQQGQGLAQVFTPQSIGLDTTSVQRAGAGISDALIQKSKAEQAAKAKKDAELNKKLSERKSGIYNINQEALNTGLETLTESYTSGAISEQEYQTQLDTYIKNAEALSSFETNVLKPEQAKHIDDENALVFTSEDGSEIKGNYVSYANATDWLSGTLADDEVAQDLIKQDPTLGLYNAYMQDKHQKVRKNFAQKDPDWSLAGAILSDDAWNSFLQSADENTRAELSDYDSEYKRKTLITQKDDIREQLLDHVASNRPDILGKWVKQKKFDEGLSNDYVSNVLFSENYKPLVAETFRKELSSLILPTTKTETKQDFIRRPSASGSGEEKAFDATVADMDKTDFNQLFDFKESWKEATGEEIGDDIATAKFRQKVKETGADIDNIKHVRLRSTKAGEQMKPIDFKGENGTIRDIYVDDSGKGFAVIDTQVTEQTATGSTKDGGTRTSTSRKLKEPKTIILEPKDTRYLQDLYQVDFTGQTKPQQKEDNDPLGLGF